MTSDLTNVAADAPAFFFHLGDVIYNFGEAAYYYDQFYEPFRDYDRPIFAIPGNHDGAVTYLNGGNTPDVPSLQAFIGELLCCDCQAAADGGGLARTTMTQPGVYWTLDAPFVSIIGLYTNVLEGPGVITDQADLSDARGRQAVWLAGQRADPPRSRAKSAAARGHRRLSPSPGVSRSRARWFHRTVAGSRSRVHEAGLWPDAILSGHAHVYQRFSRAVNGKAMPYVVAGSGGHAQDGADGREVRRSAEDVERFHAGHRPNARLRLPDRHRRHAHSDRPDCDDRLLRPGESQRRRPGHRHTVLSRPVPRPHPPQDRARGVSR